MQSQDTLSQSKQSLVGWQAPSHPFYMTRSSMAAVTLGRHCQISYILPWQILQPLWENKHCNPNRRTWTEPKADTAINRKALVNQQVDVA